MKESNDSSENSSPTFCNQDALCICPIKKIYKERDKVDCPYMATLKTENILVRNPYNQELFNVRPFFDFMHKHYESDINEYFSYYREGIHMLFNYIHFPDNQDQVKIKNIFFNMVAYLDALKSYCPDITKSSPEIKELIKDLLPDHSLKYPEKRQGREDIP